MRIARLVSIIAAAVLSVTARIACADVPARSVTPVRTFASGMLRVEQFGAAGKPAVILIPALSCGSWEWAGQIPLLAATHTVYAVTLPGFDGVPAVREDRLMERAVDALRRLISSQHLSHPAIVGHSLGGTLAVSFAEREPGVAGAVVAVEGARPIAPTREARDKAVEGAVKPYLHVSQAAFGATLRTAMLRYVVTAPRDVDAVEKLAARSDPAAVVAWMRAALPLDLTPRLSSIAVPFEEIVPFDRRIDPYQGFPSLADKRGAYQRWVGHAPHGSVVMIEPARHFVLFDRPAAFNRALLAAIAVDSKK